MASSLPPKVPSCPSACLNDFLRPPVVEIKKCFDDHVAEKDRHGSRWVVSIAASSLSGNCVLSIPRQLCYTPPALEPLVFSLQFRRHFSGYRHTKLILLASSHDSG